MTQWEQLINIIKSNNRQSYVGGISGVKIKNRVLGGIFEDIPEEEIEINDPILAPLTIEDAKNIEVPYRPLFVIATTTDEQLGTSHTANLFRNPKLAGEFFSAMGAKCALNTLTIRR